MNKHVIAGKYKVLLYLSVPLLLAVVSFFLKGNKIKEEYVFDKVKYGNIEKTVTCTGIINAKGTVEVGSRISGTINKLYADYNDSVYVNKVLAVLDTLILSKEYAEVRSIVERKKNKLYLSRKECANATVLFEKKLISNREYLSYRTNYMIDSSDYKSEFSKLEKFKATIGYAYIRSPINGVVIDRNIEEGQTIAANFTTPVLYVIAKDLNKMEILVSVDESDISAIKVSQKARFTVNAYPDSTFYGKVKEIRMKPKMVQNVVTYIVVIDTENKKHLLLPGMTATVDFIVEEKKNVLMVPVSAVRFHASKEMLVFYNEKTTGAKHDAIFEEKNNNKSGNKAQIWFFDKNRELIMESVITGRSDFKNIEILKYKQLAVGINVITGFKDVESSTKKQSMQIIGPTSSSPGGGGPPPGM